MNAVLALIAGYLAAEWPSLTARAGATPRRPPFRGWVCVAGDGCETLELDRALSGAAFMVPRGVRVMVL